MIEEPKAMKEIHEIRLAIYEKTKGLSLHEKIERMKKRADEEWERIMGKKKAPGVVAEETKKYGTGDD